VEICSDGSDNDCDPSTSCFDATYVDGTGGSLTVGLSGLEGGQIAQMDDPGENPLSALDAVTGLGTLTYNSIACCNDGIRSS
jgi:hypothetical protein